MMSNAVVPVWIDVDALADRRREGRLGRGARAAAAHPARPGIARQASCAFWTFALAMRRSVTAGQGPGPVHGEDYAGGLSASSAFLNGITPGITPVLGIRTTFRRA